MLTALVRWSLSYPRLLVFAGLLFLAYGGIKLADARFDVFPEFVPAQADVQTEAPGLTAEQVEQLVTRPIEQAVNGAAGVAMVRSESIQGLSVVNISFAEGADPFRARQVVSESLAEVAATLPAGVDAPKVAPLTSSTMDLLKVGFTSDRLSPAALRDTIQYVVRPRMLAVPGVARATLYGGVISRIEVRVDPRALAARGIGFADVIAAVKSATGVIGGGYIDTPQQRILIETRGQARGPADIAATQVANHAGTITRIGDIASVMAGPSPDIGGAIIMGKPGVLISMSSQYGANTLATTHAVERALAELEPALAARGVNVQHGLHRPANFIETALINIAWDLLIGALLIAIVLFLFMRDLRTVLISFISIPLSLVAAVTVLSGLGYTINTMTLGGLAVALGVIVDDAVIDVENIVRRLRGAAAGVPPVRTILLASIEVRAPVIYATLVVAAVLVPVLLLHGLQGAFFSPLAAAFILATMASLCVAIIVTPALSLLLLGKVELPPEPALLGRAKNAHAQWLRRVCERPRAAFAISGAAILAALIGLLLFGGELLPAFKEGHFVLAVSAQPGTSLRVMEDYGRNITRDLLAIPGVDTVEQQVGRAQGGEDNWGTERSEFHVELKAGLSGSEQDRIEANIHTVLDSYPGLNTEVLTFLGDRIGESLTGETAALAIGIYGADLDTLDRVAGEVAVVLKTIPGATDVQLKTPPSTPVVRVDLDLPKLAQFGLSATEALATVQTAYQGAATTQIYTDDRATDVAVTIPPELRGSPESVGRLLLRSSAGITVALGRVAHVYLAEGRTSIAHVGGRAQQTVTANPDPSQVARVTDAARQSIAAKVKLPPGVYLEFSGTAEGAVAARNDILANGAMAAAGVIALLVIAFGNGRSAALIMGAAPMALVGGVAAVALTGATLSLGALVGFVTLFGIAARNAILLVAHVEQLVSEEGRPWSLDTLLLATRERVTPILMTALVTALGLLPLAIGTGETGREIQGPMSIVILGGLISSTAMSLLVLPPLMWRYWRPQTTA
ncbi:heavy metal efflux pump, CzcA family [Sphingomonas sp. YR710]|uniref:efflux RND transporter permease subunit n=1 Tax=Sphingomonas sp. YR710 TaxID=1882773 RepID=UPI0008905027|nr:efflux RND transporter permease subunit [Sphingomonas sp. YR710]SDD60289.1 heavy metal efflux pump, CzcA family [Sphingomonas sp. YR710]